MDMRPRCLLVYLTLLLFLVAGCTAGLNASITPAVDLAGQPQAMTSLRFFNGSQAIDAIRSQYPIAGSEESAVVAACQPPGVEFAPLLVGGLSFVAKPLIKFVADQIDAALQRELKRYASAYTGEADVDFYVPAVTTQQAPRLRYTCFRVTRLDKSGVAFDFVGSLAVVDRERLRVTPVRLYLARPAANVKKDGTVGIAVSFEASTVYREENVGQQDASAFPATKLVAEKMNPAKGPFYKFYTKAKGIDGPLLSWSRYGKVTYGGSRASVKVAVAESGEIPWLLSTGAVLFHGHKDDLVDLLSDAAKKAMGGEDNTAKDERSNAGTNESSSHVSTPAVSLRENRSPAESIGSSSRIAEGATALPATDERPALPFPPGIAPKTQCGLFDDLQDVELYDGTLGTTREYVNTNEVSTFQLQWVDGRTISRIAPGYAPGNIPLERWCTGTLITRELAITAGHCFDVQTGETGWVSPSRERSDGSVEWLEPKRLAQLQVANFNYQVDRDTGHERVAVVFPVVGLLEHRKGMQQLDYAVIKLGKNSAGRFPGDLFPPAVFDSRRPSIGEQIVVIQHPQGKPKKVEVGKLVTATNTTLYYNDIDTEGGSSGSGVRDTNGHIVGVHTNGGCTVKPEEGANSGVSSAAIAAVSAVLR